jgi:hypothetical protein
MGRRGAQDAESVDGRGIGPPVAVTSGQDAGTSGWISGTRFGPFFLAGWAAYSLVVAVITLLDIDNTLHITQSLKPATPAWKVATGEVSSWIVLTLIFPAVRALAAMTLPGQAPSWRIAVLQTLAVLIYTAVHVAGFILIRVIVYRAFGVAYGVGLDAFSYELPRDAASYAVTVGFIWFAMSLEGRFLAAIARGTPPVFEIRDNAHVVRVTVQDILAVSAAGNYVEFHLADGRTRLMRATLARIEGQLKPHGFARIHRSWLANTARVAEIIPVGSGDFTLKLPGDLQIPMSRRFRQDFAAAPA